MEKMENSDNDDDDDFFDDDDDQELERIRNKRLQMLKKENEMKKAGYGEYREIKENEFLDEVTHGQYCLVHFYHSDFETCKIMDKHLKLICKNHINCKFLYLNAEKAPFFVSKLAVFYYFIFCNRYELFQLLFYLVMVLVLIE